VKPVSRMPYRGVVYVFFFPCRVCVKPVSRMPYRGVVYVFFFPCRVSFSAFV